MVWIIDDEGMEHLLGVDCSNMFVAKQLNPDASVLSLFRRQNKYKSYSGFKDFYHNQFVKFYDGASWLNDGSKLGKAINGAVRKYIIR